MDNAVQNLKIHFNYCAFIATMVIILLATEKWSSSQGFTTYLSNAATMTSLLLGVVAIFYSFISNDGMSRSLGSISTVTTEVREVRGDIQKFSEQTKISVEAAVDNNNLVRSASDKLSEAMTSLDITLQAISSQNEALKDLVTILPTRIDQLETKFGDVAKGILEKPVHQQDPPEEIKIPDEIVENFLEYSTFSQNLFSIACVLSYETGKPLDLLEFCKVVEWNGVNQFMGFLSCMHVMQLCTRHPIPGKDKSFSISKIHPVLAQRAQAIFTADVSAGYEKKPEFRDKLMGRLAAVEALYK